MVRFSLFIISLVLVLTTTSAKAHYVWIDCENPPGITLCRSMKQIQDLLNYTCTGNACYRLWDSQIKAMRRFSRTMNTEVPVGIKAPELVGQLAYDAAEGICRTSAKGDCAWIEAIFTAKREALAGLVELQKAAGKTVVKKCSLSYSCP